MSPMENYRSIPDDEEQASSLDESLNERATFLKHFTRVQNNTNSWSRWRMLEVALFVILGTLLTINIFKTGIPTPQHTYTNQNHGRPDIQLRFGDERKYMSLNHDYDKYWAPVMDSKGGLIRTNPDDVDGIPQWGGIAMFHQLHCIAGLRMALQRAKAGEDIGENEDDDSHWPHCMWYLRQTILCMADATIEMPTIWKPKMLDNGTVVPHRGGAIDGVNDLRVCKNSQELYEMRAKYGSAAEEAREAFFARNHGH